MNEPEREKLNRFLQELVQTRAGAKDLEAERLIRENCNYQPDASYLLVQRALVLEDALKTAHEENARLRAEIDRLRGTSTGFLNDNAWGNTRQLTNPAGAATAAAPDASERGSALVGTMATTAAGVVAGSLLFHGIEQMMGNAKGSGFIDNRNAGSGADAAPAMNDARADQGDAADGDALAALVPSAADLDSI